MTSHKIMQGIPVPPGARVPRQDWDRAPWNRWSFHNIREILPTKEVWRGHGRVWRLDSAAQDLGSIAFTLSDGGQTTVQPGWTTTSPTASSSCIMAKLFTSATSPP
jgi:hypothetical protein